MTKLEELINELCPDGVEYKKLADVCNFNRGTSLVSKNAKSGDIPVISGGQKPAFYHNLANRTGTTITVAGSGAYAGYVSIWYEPIFVCDAFSVEPKNADELDIKYLYHYLTNNQNKIYNKKTGAGIPHVHGKDIAKFSIPLPPLSIQSEIVHILDSFTSLTAELTAELTARQKQYAFYRDYLLDFSDEDVTKKIPDIDCSNVEYKRLGDIALVTKLAGYEFTKYVTYSDNGNIIALRGLNVKNGQLVLDDVKYIDNSDLSKLNRSKLVTGDMLFTYVGTIGQVALIDKNDRFYLAPNVAMIRLNDKERILPKYLMHFFQTNLFWNSQINKLLQSSSMKNIPMEKIRKFVIPVPHLSVQENIVKILDRFDKLNNDMSDGLPAEIEARKKQYEYYRDTLLSFDDKACSQIVKVERERELTRIKAIKWLSIQDLFDLRNGYTPSKSKSEYWTNGTIPWFRMEDIRENGHILNDSIQHITPIAVKGKLFPANSIILATSATIGEHALITVDSLANQRFTYLTAKNEYSNQLNMKYVFYYFFKIDEWCKNNLNVSSFASVDMDKFKKLKFPIPPLKEQERIVSILDRFDKLCNDISEGLPAEIEARQKQYEYYRDKLLTFKITN